MNEKIPQKLWIIVDKRGTILEKANLVRTSADNLEPDVPLFSVWRDRSSAIETVIAIKANMSKETWDTWQFRVVKYALAK